MHFRFPEERIHLVRCRAIAALEARHFHAVADQMNALLWKPKVREDFLFHHLRVDDDASSVVRIKRLLFQPQHIPVKGAAADERLAPPWGELASSSQPDAMHAVASPINILLPRPFQTEDT